MTREVTPIQCAMRVEPPYLLRIHPNGHVDRWPLAKVAAVTLDRSTPTTTLAVIFRAGWSPPTSKPHEPEAGGCPRTR